MNYDICKDNNPKNTIENIITILNNCGIKLEEHFVHRRDYNKAAYSLRVTIEHTTIGANGKGTSELNSRASAYAEFIERLQNGKLISFNIIDKKQININKIKIDKIFNEKSDNKNCSELQNLISTISKHKNIDTIPFYSVKENKKYYIPKFILDIFQRSNGMSSGNSIEEALVQGFSEVCERYVIKKIFSSNIIMPEIPKEIYMKYDNIKKIINWYNELGYIVQIKDASLGEKLPVVCTIIEDRKSNIFALSFGAHPNILIAIERTLTEFVQGFDIESANSLNITKKYNFISNVSYKYTDFCPFKIFISSPSFEYGNIFADRLFSKKSSYDFSLNSWLYTDKYIDNKYLLKYILDNTKHIHNYNIYIRNSSFLGFNSVYLFIPSMSVLIDINDRNIKNINNFILWSKYKGQLDKRYNNIESLISALEYAADCTLYSFCETPIELVILLCAIKNNDINRIKKYSDILIDRNSYYKRLTEKVIGFVKRIRDYYLNYENIYNLYSEDEIKIIQKDISNITIKSLKKYVLKHKIFLQDEKMSNNIKKIKNILDKKYKENVPDQIFFSEIFKKFDI